MVCHVDETSPRDSIARTTTSVVSRRRRRVLVIALIALCGCGGPRPPGEVDEDPWTRLTRAEATRGAGLAELSEIAEGGPAELRAEAIRGLGRVGGPAARTLLRTLAGRCDPAVANAAAAALGLAAIDESSAADLAETTQVLVAMLARPGIRHDVVYEALGRTGDSTASEQLRRGMSGAPDTAAAAAIALGRFGRRKIPLDDASRADLVTATRHADTAVRYAATWALSREFLPPGAPPQPAVVDALRARLDDERMETRVAAFAALGKRKAVATIPAARMGPALADEHWMVAVEAARAMGSEPTMESALVVLATSWFQSRRPGWAHVVAESLRAVHGAPARATLAESSRTALLQLRERSANSQSLDHAWVHCLAIAALVRANAQSWDGGAELLACGEAKVPLVARAQLVADEIARGAAPMGTRRDAAIALLSSADPVVRAAGSTGLGAVWPELTEDAQRRLLSNLTRAVGSPESIEGGSAVEALGPLLADAKTPAWARDAIAEALAARVTALLKARSVDPDLASSLLTALAGAHGDTAKQHAAAACEQARKASATLISTAAAACRAKLEGREAPLAGDRAPPPASVPPVTLLPPQSWSWRIETTAGVVVIELDGRVAPWHVSALVELTRRKFYDGLVFHRVVPGFVVQGGDPSGTGWGGPGFTLPAEPGSRFDGDNYDRGAVGIADAGKDTGGSQWFIMHTHGPHLEGRYTRVGRVISGEDVIDSLLVGDKIKHATVEHH